MGKGEEKVELEGFKVSNDKFYVLDIEGEKWVFAKESDALKALKEEVLKREEVKAEKVNILEVNMSGEKGWEIKGIPWSKIAIQLIKSSEK